MASKERLKQVREILVSEEKKMRDQIIHLNGQVVYNQRMQEMVNQLIRESVDQEVISKTPKISKTSKSKKK